MAAEGTVTDPGLRLEHGAIQLDPAGDLWIEGTRAADLADRFGTPLYVTSEAQLRQSYRELHHAFASRYPRVAILYANKANGNLAVRRILTQEGAGGDCFGIGELTLALRAGTPASLLALNGSNKQPAELRLAIEVGATINIDHPTEVERVASIAEALGRRARINLRILPFTYADVPRLDPDNAAVATDRSHDKWGMDPPTALEAASRALALPQVELRGLHLHVSRLRPTTAPFELAARLLLRAVDELRRETGWTPRLLDLGGGFAQPRDPESGTPPRGHEVSTAEAYAEAITPVLLDGFRERDTEPPEVWIEPGRRLVGSSTVLLTRVGLVKRLPSSSATWVNVDASTNHLMRIPLQGYWHAVIPVVDARRPGSIVATVVGPNCTLDAFAVDRALPPVAEGELLAVLDVGAYAEAFVSRFNLIPRPATVLVHQREAEVIRRRETIEDLFEGQEVPPRLRD